MTEEQQNFINSLIGKRVIVTGKDHPRKGDTGVISEFEPCVGITEKPGFKIKADNSMEDDFYIFSGREVTMI